MENLPEIRIVICLMEVRYDARINCKGDPFEVLLVLGCLATSLDAPKFALEQAYR
jgi:hypothetical protein